MLIYLQMFENVCEAGQEGEPSTINLSVTADMSRQEVVAARKGCG